MAKLSFGCLIILTACSYAAIAVEVGTLQKSIESVRHHVNVPPVQDNGKIDISVCVLFSAIGFLDERSNMVSVSASTTIRWSLSAAQFPTSNETISRYNLKYSVQKPQENIWTPKIVVGNMLNLDGEGSILFVILK